MYHAIQLNCYLSRNSNCIIFCFAIAIAITLFTVSHHAIAFSCDIASDARRVGGESAVCAVARVLSATTAQLRGAPPALTRPGARAQFVQLPATLTVCHAPLVHHLPAIA